jgi:hypothetical protein
VEALVTGNATLHERLKAQGRHIPAIFITAFANERTRGDTLGHFVRRGPLVIKSYCARAESMQPAACKDANTLSSITDYEADQNSHNLSPPFRTTWLGYELVAEY